MLLLSALLLALAVLPGCSDTATTSGPPTLVVPDQFPTIQAAIDAARPGEIVLVQPGVYSALERRDIDPDRYPGGLVATAFLKEGVGIVGNGDPGTVVLRDTASIDRVLSDTEDLVRELEAEKEVERLLSSAEHG